MVYDLTESFSSIHIKSYSALTKMKRIDWNNRGISTVHAIFISFMPLYFVFFSDLSKFSSCSFLIFLYKTVLMSIDVFVIGGSEYIFHHSLSGVAVAKKRLAIHWKSFIRPLMWRSKWLELRIREKRAAKRRRNRKKVDLTDDIASYMFHHNLFSYVENKRLSSDVLNAQGAPQILIYKPL
ncbi:hypothetical protein Bca4012_039725 [Brassica carinata]